MSDPGNFKVSDFKLYKQNAKKIPVLTCYDYSHARIVQNAGLDVVLVGDSLGMVILGYESTLNVTMDDMVRHTAAVRRGAKESFVIADMPYMSYHASVNDAVINAGRLIVQGGADAVKIEGGSEMEDVLKALKKAKIPVVGHIGLTPQSVNVFGGYKYQGRNSEEMKKIVEDAFVLQENGAISIVLECIPENLAELITRKLDIPTIGIGSGNHCDGQVLVLHDMLGLYDDVCPTFVKKYGNLGGDIIKSVSNYITEVKSGLFPEKIHSIRCNDELLEIIKKEVESSGNNNQNR